MNWHNDLSSTKSSIKHKFYCIYSKAHIHNTNSETFDNQTEPSFCCSVVLSRDCYDERDIFKGIIKANNALVALRQSIFSNGGINVSTHIDACKKYMYKGLPILFYPSCGTVQKKLVIDGKIVQKAARFLSQRTYPLNDDRVNWLQIWNQRISNADILARLNLTEIESYVVKCQLR